MNELAIVWTRLMLDAWKDAPPRLVLLENVPRLKTRAAGMLRKVRALLREAGYVFHDGYHDCGELGGLAQHRRRYLLVARHEKRVPPLLYQPIKRRVRACGEVLGPMPMPEDPAAGPMHRLPRISWLNWVRLALIPAGGDWRDLPGVLADGQARRTKFKRHKMEEWSAPVGTIGGSGSNGVENVADPRPAVALPASESRHWNKYAVTDWNEPARTVIGAIQPGSGGPAVADPRPFGNVDRVTAWDQPIGTITHAPAPSSGGGAVADPRVGEWGDGRMGVLDFTDPARTVRGESLPSNGPFSVADPRVPTEAFRGRLGVLGFEEPAGTVTGNGRPETGKFSVADPRPQWFNNVLKVVPWSEPTGTVTGQGRPTCGALNVADPRVKKAFDHGYAVLHFDEPSPTVAGKSHPGNGAYSIADPRLTCEPRAGAYGVLPWDEAAKTVTGAAQIDNGSFAIADPRTPDAPPVIVVRDPKKPPSATPVIISADGTWHRPLTTLELAALQGFPLVWRGAPLKLDGSASSQWRTHIGNAVPAPAAKAIAERMLASLLQADFETFSLDGDAAVWVQPEGDDESIVVGML
jgi:site-specific DNA-cytosine methylase